MIPEGTFRLHHVGCLVPDIEAASREHSLLYGYAAESPVIHDVRQTAWVQLLRLPRGNHWLELVSPDGEHSKLSTALKKGVRLHHLCYEISAMEDSCTKLRAMGLFVLAPPAPAEAFPGRKIAWLMDRHANLTELLEAGPGPFSLDSLDHLQEKNSISGAVDEPCDEDTAPSSPAS